MKIAEVRKRQKREERERKQREQEVRELKKRYIEFIRQNPTTETARQLRERLKQLENQEKWVKRREKDIDSSVKEAKKKSIAQRKVVSEGAKQLQERLRERLAQKWQKKEGGLIEKAGAAVTGAIEEISLKIPETIDNTIEQVVKRTNPKAGEFFSNPKEKGKSSEAEKEELEPPEAPIGLPEEDMEISPEKKQNSFLDTPNLKSPETSQKPEVSLQPTESDASIKQRLIDPQFLELTKDYSQQIGEKINHGLKVRPKFRNWIRRNPTLEPSEKQRLLEYCDYYEALIKKAIMGQVLFSDKSLEKIRRYINKKFDMLASTYAVTDFTKEKLREKEFSKRFGPTPRKILPRQIPEIVHKYKQGAKETELAKEYNVHQCTIHRYLKNQEVESHVKREINRPQEFTPDLAKFITLIMTEGYLAEHYVEIENTSYALIEEFKNLVRRNFQVDNFSEYVGDDNPNWKKPYICRLYSVELVKFLSKYVEKSDYQKATLPKEIFALSEEDIGEVLRIAFSAEGSVSLRPVKSSERERWNIRKKVEFTCASPSLKKQWRNLIESLGIKCRVSKEQIRISREENIIKFNEKIGFMEGISIKKNSLWEGATRQEVLNALIESYKYPRMGFDSKEQALMFLNSLFKK